MRWTARIGFYTRAGDIGGNAVWYHLHEKGYIDIDYEVGPRGGRHLLVRLREI